MSASRAFSAPEMSRTASRSRSLGVDNAAVWMISNSSVFISCSFLTNQTRGRRPARGAARGASSVTQSPETLAHVVDKRLRLLPCRAMRAFRLLLVLAQPGIVLLGPLARDCARYFLQERAHHDRNLDALQR